jgi:hypothetical protein
MTRRKGERDNREEGRTGEQKSNDFFSRSSQDLVDSRSSGADVHQSQVLVLEAPLAAVRRRRPRGTLIHSDQGTQYGSDGWRAVLPLESSRAEYQPEGQLLGQCRRRIVLWQSEEPRRQRLH